MSSTPPLNIPDRWRHCYSWRHDARTGVRVRPTGRMGGDDTEQSFETFVRAEIDGLARYAGVLVRDRQLAHDVLADALIAASARWPRIAGMANPLGYVQRIVVTTYLADRRKVARRRTDPADVVAVAAGQESPNGSPDPADAAGDRDEIERMLRGLPRQQRAAVVLRYYLDWPDTEIGQALGCSAVTVRSHLSRALAALRATAVDGRATPAVAKDRAGTTAEEGSHR